MRFAKGHGTENDFVILLDPDGSHGLSAALAARLCDRHAGIGADGVLRAVRAEVVMPAAGQQAAALPEWFMDYRNSDGSTAEMCGNGIRVFARYLAARGLAGGPEFTVATRAGFRRVTLEDDGTVTADMGAVEMLGPGRAVVDGRVCAGLRVGVGNPHLACLVDTGLDGFDLSRAPEIDPAEFPDGANVELVLVTGPTSARMRVHERGSGETRSCGTGAVAAAAAAAHAAGQREGSWHLTVPGGQLTVTLEGANSRLTGPAVIVAEGELDPGWLAAAVPAAARS